jgi:metal-sulfur cluster biosynthetic enzyme
MTTEGEPSSLREKIEESLRQVIDPETGADVMRMHLVKDLEILEGGEVRYTFQPSSPLCPIAVFLAVQIKKAVADVAGVCGQEIRVEGYIAAEDLTQLINEEK